MKKLILFLLLAVPLFGAKRNVRFDNSQIAVNDFIRFTGLDGMTTGRSYSEVRIDLGVVIGTDIPALSGDVFTGKIQFSGTTFAGIQHVSLTTTERDALTPINGDVIYNETDGQVQGYMGGAWTNLGAGAGSGEANTASNLGGGLANYDSQSTFDLRFNTFNAADFDLATNLLSIDDATWLNELELDTFAELDAQIEDVTLIHSASALNGELLSDDTVDDDSIDFSLVTLADFTNDAGFTTTNGNGQHVTNGGVVIGEITQAALEIDVYENSIRTTASDAETYTFSATPANGSGWSLRIVNGDAVADTITLPSTFDEGTQTTAAHTLTIPASGQVTLGFYREAARTSVIGLPTTAASLKTIYESNADTNEYDDAEQTKVSHLTVTQAVDLDTMETDVAANNAKTSNAVHTGDVTGGTALTIAANAVDNTMVDETQNYVMANLAITPTTLTYAATTNIDFNLNGIRTLALTGNVTFTTSNLTAGEAVAIKILCDATLRTLTFPAGWIFLGAAAPTDIAVSKTAVLTLQSFGTADTDVVAGYAVEP